MAAEHVTDVEVGAALVQLEPVRIGRHDELGAGAARVVRDIVVRMRVRVVDAERQAVVEATPQLELHGVVRRARTGAADARDAELRVRPEEVVGKPGGGEADSLRAAIEHVRDEADVVVPDVGERAGRESCRRTSGRSCRSARRCSRCRWPRDSAALPESRAMNPFETRSIWLTLIMRNRLLPRVPTYETSTTVFFRISRWNPAMNCCMYGVATSSSKNSGCSLRRLGGVRLIAGGVVSCGTPSINDSAVPDCGYGSRPWRSSSFSRRT